MMAAKQVDVKDHPFAVIDHTGVIFPALVKAAEEHNKESGPNDARTGPYFQPRQVDLGGKAPDDVKLALSDQVKSKDLFAFVEVPASVLDIDDKSATAIGYYTETASYQTLPDWIEEVLDKEIAARRFAKASVDPQLVEKLTKTPRFSTLGLVERGEGGEVKKAKRVDGIETFVLPFGLMYLLFIAIMTSAPQLLNAVLEEKMSRISEVLISAVTPFQLMMGKLLGVTAVAVILASLYLAGGSYALIINGRFDIIPARDLRVVHPVPHLRGPDVRLAVSLDWRRRVGLKGRAGHDAAGDGHHAHANRLVRGGDPEPGLGICRRRVDDSCCDAVPDVDPARPQARTADVAAYPLGRAHHRRRCRLRLGRRPHLPRRPADARQGRDAAGNAAVDTSVDRHQAVRHRASALVRARHDPGCPWQDERIWPVLIPNA